MREEYVVPGTVLMFAANCGGVDQLAGPCREENSNLHDSEVDEVYIYIYYINVVQCISCVFFFSGPGKKHASFPTPSTIGQLGKGHVELIPQAMAESSSLLCAAERRVCNFSSDMFEL